MRGKIGYFLGALISICMIFVLDCQREKDTQSVGKDAKEKAEGGALTLYNWEEYIGSDTLANFEKETGIHVTEINFKDEDEMLGAVQSDLSAYDLVVTSDETVWEMREAKMLAPLDLSKIPNLKYIDKKYRNMPYDPEQRYSVPYMTGTTGIVVNTKYIQQETDSWKVLFDPRYRGKLAMLNNQWEVIGTACKLLGYALNTTDLEELDRAREVLLKQKSLLQGYFDAVTLREKLIGEELWAAQIYNGEGMLAVDENEELEYVIPKEGTAILRLA